MTPPLSTMAGLLLTPLLISIGQILFKLTSRRAGELNPAGVLATLFDPYLLTALFIYGIGTVIWVYVLKAVPLTVAYPFMALTFCIVPILAWTMLGESLSIKYATGTLLIVVGLVIINV